MEGGSRSGKTWAILQNILLLCQSSTNLTFTISRLNLTWIKATVLKDFEEITELYKFPVTPLINPNRPEQRYAINGNEIAFIGADEEKKLHGRKQDYFWFNEGMDFDKKTFNQVEQRTTIGGWIDYNPNCLQHWIYELDRRKDVDFNYSTIIDNPFAPPEVVIKILSYEPTKENISQGTADKYMWSVYGLGKRAELEGLVFPGWQFYDELPKTEWEIYGLDFGFTNSPTALVRIYKAGNNLYLEEMLYETNLTNAQIGSYFETKGLIKRSDVIIADSAEPKSIEELCRMGWIVKPASKGKDSVMHGIQSMRGFKINVNKNSLNLQNEIKGYIFEADKEGKSINAPRKVNDHLIDAARYATEYKLKPKKQVLFA